MRKTLTTAAVEKLKTGGARRGVPWPPPDHPAQRSQVLGSPLSPPRREACQADPGSSRPMGCEPGGRAGSWEAADAHPGSSACDETPGEASRGGGRNRRPARSETTASDGARDCTATCLRKGGAAVHPRLRAAEDPLVGYERPPPRSEPRQPHARPRRFG